MTPAERTNAIESLTKRWRAFPNLSTLASYEHFSQTIHLATVSSADFAAAFRDRDYTARRRVVPLVYHELTHWADHVTTVWGMSFLVRQFNAINARRGDKEAEYWRVVDLVKAARRHHYGDYYTLIYPKGYEPPDGNPWRWQLSMGATFDGDGRPDESAPIAFTKFRNASDEDVCRVPFSVASLLEVNAMASEMELVFGIANELEPDARLVETSEYSRKTLKDLYDPLLAVYTVAAHLFANRARVKDVLTAYDKASRVAGFCLNFPRALFPQLVVPESFAVWGARNENMKARHDRGYLYMLLLAHATGVDIDDMNAWFSTVLARAGLPPMDDIRRAAEEELSSLFAEGVIPGPSSDRLTQLLSVGRNYQRDHGLRLNGRYEGLEAIMPPVLLSDGIIFRPKNALRHGTFANPDEWIDRAWRNSNLVTEFLDACLP